mmetsp:Transcript_25633/g.70722  ORF Transcript_25633/g.70722 Transcript_25633/m.70722 type:complete len:421 (+) Transcript_25633:94-1356(+)
MAAQEQQPPAISELLPHAWSGANKTVDELTQESDTWLSSVPPSEILQRMLGNHFTHMEDVWGSKRYRVVVQDFSNITRTKSQGALYQSCYAHIENDIRDPDWTSGTANQRGNSEKVDPVGNLGGQSAHLLSHAKVCHRAYPFLAQAAIGINVQDLNLDGNLHTNRRKLLVGVQGGHHFTSLKGHKFNKMYWKLQGEHFDSDDPSVLVVPLLPLEQIKNWTMHATHAVDYDVAVFTFGPRKKVVARETLQMAKGTCSPTEVTLARENLTYFVKGIAAHLIWENVFESLPEKYFVPSNPSLLRWKSLVEQLKGNPEILIPIDLASIPRLRIAKARMSTGTSLPDPWLLLAKSAINYSASNGQKLMPACPLPEESDSEDDDCGIPNESGGKGEEMSSLTDPFYLGALRRVGFGCQVPMEAEYP